VTKYSEYRWSAKGQSHDILPNQEKGMHKEFICLQEGKVKPKYCPEEVHVEHIDLTSGIRNSLKIDCWEKDKLGRGYRRASSSPQVWRWRGKEGGEVQIT